MDFKFYNGTRNKKGYPRLIYSDTRIYSALSFVDIIVTDEIRKVQGCILFILYSADIAFRMQYSREMQCRLPARHLERNSTSNKRKDKSLT